MPEETEMSGEPTTDETTETEDPGRAGGDRQHLNELAQERRARKAAETAAKTAADELETLRRSSMSDQEKAIATAKAEAKAETLAAVSLDRVRDKVEAAAGARFADPEDAHALLGDLSHFVGNDGTVDSKGIKRALDDLLKTKPYLAAGPRPGGDYDGGAGTPTGGEPDMNSLIRKRVRG